MQRRNFLQMFAAGVAGMYLGPAALLSRNAVAAVAVRGKQAEGDTKIILEQINALRAAPANAQATMDRFILAGIPDPKWRADALKEDVGDGKTHAQYLAAFVAWLKTQPAAPPLRWDSDLVAVSANGGKSSNAYLKPEHFIAAFDKDPKLSLLWPILKGTDFEYKPLFNPALRYIGASPSGDKMVITASALPGKTFLRGDEEVGKNAYDPRLDPAPAWVGTFDLREPNIIPFVKADGTLDVVWRMLGSKQVMITRITADGSKVWSKPAPGVDSSVYKLLMGFTEDPEGNLYVVRAQDEAPPPANVAQPKDASEGSFDRSDIVRITKLDSNAAELWTKDFAKSKGGAAAYYSPLSASGKGEYGASARVVYTTFPRPGAEAVPMIFLIYGGATEYDPDITGRHQSAYWRAVDARTGEPIEGMNGTAEGHSYDYRALVTPEGVITAEHNDSFMLMSNYLATRPGPIYLGVFNTFAHQNEGFKQMGGLVPTDDGYLLLFAANNNPGLISVIYDQEAPNEQAQQARITPRDLCIVRVKTGFAQALDALQDKDKAQFDQTLDFRAPKTDAAKEQTLLLPKYITSYYRDKQPYSAGRPKIVRLDDSRYVVFWERWRQEVVTDDGKKDLSGSYDSTWAMLIDKNGNTLKPAVKISDTARLMRGDDPVLWNGRAAWVSGDAAEDKLVLNTIDSGLTYQATPLAL